jgi:hypothetical protein
MNAAALKDLNEQIDFASIKITKIKNLYKRLDVVVSNSL